MTQRRPPSGALDASIQEVLSLLARGESMSPERIVQEIRQRALRFDQTEAESALRRLSEFGLARRSSSVENVPEYVSTTLGREYAGTALGPEAELSERLSELEQLRTDLVATIAHELKTPLTAIRTCIGLLMDTEAHADEATRKRLLARVATSADGMQQVIQSLLDLARYRSGNYSLEPRWIDAVELTRDAVAQITPLLEAARQQIDLSCPSELRIYGDRRRLLQAVGNVLANAQRFSPDGSTIGLTVGNKGRAIEWIIRDTGPGISEADQRHLFERFFRGRSDVEAGSGLGLPIALAAVQAHHGAIEVTSTVGEGSTFTITVPQGSGDTRGGS